MSLTRWFPEPTLVEIGGNNYEAHELRLKDLAALESFAAAAIGPLLDGLEPTSQTYADDLRAVYDTAENGWPPPISSPIVSRAIFGTTEGLAHFLSRVLRDTPADECEAIASVITQEELASVEKVSWGIEDKHRELIIKRIDAYLGFANLEYEHDQSAGRPISWEKSVGEVVTTVPWATPEAIANLSLSQWRLVRTGGGIEEESDPLPADTNIRAEVLAARRKFFGLVVGDAASEANKPVTSQHEG